jgi:hypothetical protein
MKTNKRGTKVGMNPNSHGNNKKAPEDRAIAKEVTLYDRHWKIAHKLGNTEYSRGLRVLADMAISTEAENIDKLFATLPVMSRVKIALQMILENKEHSKITEYAKNVLLDLEELEVKQAYTKAVTDKTIQ